MEKPPTLLFDLDGTLAETAPDLCSAVNYILLQNGLKPIGVEEIRGMIGGGARKILQRGLESQNVIWDEEELTDGTERLIDYYHDHIADQTVLFDGLLPVLQTCHGAHIPMAVVTNKRYKQAEKLLTLLHIRDYFGVVVGGDSLPTRKPDPAMLLHAINALNANPKTSIMIGDSEADCVAAKAANIRSIVVRFGYHQGDIEDLAATAVIDHFDAFLPTLNRLQPSLNLPETPPQNTI